MRLVRAGGITFDPTGAGGEYDRGGRAPVPRAGVPRLIDRLPPLVGERPETRSRHARVAQAGFPAAQGRTGGGEGSGRGTGGGRQWRYTEVPPGGHCALLGFDVVSVAPGRRHRSALARHPRPRQARERRS
jgi:hypothetical protein